MSLLNVAKTDESIQEETNTVGGGGPLDTALYPIEISLAWLEKKASGAVFLNLTLRTDEGNDVRQGLCIASGDSKGNKNYYETANGERKYLPGFNHAQSLARLTVGKELADLDTEEKVINVYSPTASKEVPTKVEMVMDLVGQRAIIGLQKQIVDKNAKGDDGRYHATGETREVNEIDKVFRESDKMTTAEILAHAEEATFYDTWDKKFTGKTINRATGGAAANDANGAAGAPVSKPAFGGGQAAPAPTAGGQQRQSLFGQG